MSVLKFLHEKDPFARIPNDTARDKLLMAESLGVITYLASWPETWVPREMDVRRRFGWGKDKMRTVWKNLEEHGYAQRLHRQQLGQGRIGTITKIAVRPVFLTDTGTTGSGRSDTGEADNGGTDNGDSTTLKRRTNTRKNEKKKYIKKPVASGDGEASYSDPRNQLAEVQFEIEKLVGFEFPCSLASLDDPERVAAIFGRYKLNCENARNIAAEFDACASRRTIDNPWGLLAKLSCIAASPEGLALSAEGEKRLPSWS